ncbi:hypothetical protein [Listeria booriae]|uniref:Uncharacterized protein n=1 Tax=Listeria booriae TaxID=1552123 RepID=A0A842FGU2_9LIST|nr:hypothetical protein [Listeria booriae]MBC2242226.1 hypothetical protein [Listeria booriae]
MMEKNKVLKLIISVISLLVIAASIYYVVKQTNEYKELVQEKTVAEGQVATAKKTYEKQKEKVQQDFYAADHENDPQVVKDVSAYNNSYGIMNDLATRFFAKYFTWETSSDYQARASKLGTVATDRLLKNTKIFDSGKDSLGGDYIANTGVKSEFVSADPYMENADSALVKVKYTSWFNDERGSTAETATRYYYVKLNSSEHKLDSLNLVFSSKG